jgi:prepilin-type N-terminal cleavage/methylation domain-containing protein
MGEVMRNFTIFKRNDDSGFTLLEVMISLSILAVGILGVVGMFTTSIGGNAQGKHMTEATDHAQSKLDYQANAEIFANLTSGSETNGIYTITWQKTEPIPALGNKLKKIKVTTSWQTKGVTHKVELETLRAKN